MNVTINGYVSFSCNSCGNPHTLDSHSYQFTEDTSKEAEEDEYIRYLANINIRCPDCSNPILVRLDVWEFPEAVVNYSYHGEQGTRGIQCEFSIEHYFDDNSMSVGDAPFEPLAERDNDPDDGSDDEDAEDSPPPIETYMDRYDDDD